MDATSLLGCKTDLAFKISLANPCCQERAGSKYRNVHLNPKGRRSATLTRE